MRLKAVVPDWAGTIIDYGSHAPMGAFVKVLSERRLRCLAPGELP